MCISTILARADTETRQLVLTPGDHVAVFSAPATAQDTRFLELSVKPNSKATATIPGDSGWAYGSAANNKNILVDQCDSDPANNSMTLSYQGAPLGNGAYSFLTFIDDGLITYCGEGGGAGSNSDHSFTLLITDENTVLILPNPAYAVVSTEQATNWIELKALRWEFENGANKEIPTVVDWTPVLNLSFAQTKEGPVMTDEQVDAYEGTTIWVKSNTPGIYTVLASTLEESGTASKVITGTLNILSVESVEVVKPETGTWDPLPWETVLLDGQDLKVKILITHSLPSLDTFIDACTPVADIRTFSVDNAGTESGHTTAQVSITAQNATLENGNEIRLTIPTVEVQSLGLVSKSEDSEDEKCSADSQILLNGPSNRRDSDGFDANAPGLQRGLARGDGDINAAPPESKFNKEFIQAAGVLNIDVTVLSAISEKRQVQEQSDIFYYSGHGSHATAKLAGIAGPADVAPHWDDIDKFIAAGCAVLDINDYNDNYTVGGGHADSPGLKWKNLAPDIFLGYNWIAPLDDNVGDPDFTKDIVVGYLTSGSPSEILKWMNSNKAKATTTNRNNPGQRPWNACVIDMRNNPGVYWFFDYNNLVDGKPTLNFKLESDW